MTKTQKETVDFALCYLLSNSDDESVLEHLEDSTKSGSSIHHTEYIQKIIDKNYEQ